MTVTVAPPGLNTRCTCGFPWPVTVTVTVVVAPAASVPDIGETTTFLVRPGGSRTVQLTGPPEALRVIVPAAGGVTLSVVGRTFRVPAAGALLVGVVGGAVGAVDAEGEGSGRLCVGVGLATGWLLVMGLGRAVRLGRGVAVRPAVRATGLALAVAAPASGGIRPGGVVATTASVIAVAATAVPAAMPT